MSLTETEPVPPQSEATELETPQEQAPETPATPDPAPQANAPLPDAEPKNETTTPINPWDDFNNTLDGSLESASTDASLVPPVDPQAGDRLEDEELPGESDTERALRIAEQYGSDPIKLANALLHLRRKVSQQGVQKPVDATAPPAQSTQTPVPESRDASIASIGSVGSVPADNSIPPVPTPQTPAPVAVELPGDGIRPEDIYNPETWKHSEETGWPLDSEGDEVAPVDEFGITFTPQSVWDKRLEQLEEETGSAARALDAVSREKQADLQRYSQEYNEKFKVVSDFQMRNLRNMEPEIAKKYSQYEEPVAKGLAFEIGKAAYEFYHQEVAAGQLSRQQMKDPQTVKKIADNIRFLLYDSGQTDAYADKIRQALPKATVPPEPNGSAPGGVPARNGAPPPAGGSSGGAAPAVQTAKTQVTGRAKEVALVTGLDPEEAETFTRKGFTFDIN